MSLKEERELNPTSRDQVNRAKNAAQSKNFDYAITLLQAALKDEPLFSKAGNCCARLKFRNSRP
jgi:hypothetical protein